MQHRPFFVLVLGLVVTQGPLQDGDPQAAEIVAAERAFAADSPVLGIVGSFTRWSVSDAVVLHDGAVLTVRDVYPPSTPRLPDEPTLRWWPTFAGVAQSADLGFTTGPVEVDGHRSGHYFTIWRRQSDRSWKWVYDGGTAADASTQAGPDTQPVLLPTSEFGSDSPASAWLEVRTAEAALAYQALKDQKAAHLAVLAPGGRIYVGQQAPASGSDAFSEALAYWPATFDFGAAQGGAASDAGDMVWTYGAAAWSRAGQGRTGHYVRLWQKQADGWRLVLAQLVAAPPIATVQTALTAGN